MNNDKATFSTGLPGLDSVLKSVMPGDSFVWQIGTVDNYKPFVEPLCQNAATQGKKLVYFRFAQHPELLNEETGAEIIYMRSEQGFEKFIHEIFNVIERTEEGAYYVFDCLTELLADWNSDRMLSNFFLLICPFLSKCNALSYFALLRNRHSFHATDGIFEKARIILDIYRDKDKLYIHPLKVHERHSATIYTLHRWDGDTFLPVTNSTIVSEILASVPQPWLDFTYHRLGAWTRTFARAHETQNEVQMGKIPASETDIYYTKILRMAVTRDMRFLRLAEKYLDFSDLLNIRKRMIGTGLIGGKSVGMLLARAILRKEKPQWNDLLEAHDSFYIGSDVFYTYLVQNECWWVRRKKKNLVAMLEVAGEARQRMLKGRFPKYIRDQFAEMLNYFGQVPIIVRSSSLLEDNYGNSFSGKYESVFCANQGTPAERLEAFIDAVRRVYASTMSKEALTYRAQKGLLENDEQMGLLIQRVSGDVYSNLFFPQFAGVGYSFNPYVWSKDIDPNVGMLRLVFGLGTRAVDRHDDDYTRIVALNVPSKRPESNFDQVRRYAQQHVDVLNLNENQHLSIKLQNVIKSADNLPLELFASKDERLEELAREKGIDSADTWVLTFEGLFSKTSFVEHMRGMLEILQKAYNYPVDIEFTVNFLEDGSYRINLLQCRPFQVKREKESVVESPKDVKKSNIIFRTNGPILGNSVVTPLDWIIYIVPSEYANLPQNKKYAIARLIGKVTHLEGRTPEKILLLGPGRWGTTTPELGIPVSFAEINTVSALCEINVMHEGLVPDMSLGTHFYNDLVEMDLVYLGLMPKRKETSLNEAFLNKAPNLLTELLPEKGKWSNSIRVIKAPDSKKNKKIYLYVDALKQEALCYVRKV